MHFDNFNHTYADNCNNIYTFVMIQKLFCKNRDIKACEIVVLILVYILNRGFSLASA